MRAHSQEDRVPTELDIEGGYQGDAVTGRQRGLRGGTRRHAACGGHRRSHLKSGLREHHRYPLANVRVRKVSLAAIKVRPLTARTAIYALKPPVASNIILTYK